MENVPGIFSKGSEKKFRRRVSKEVTLEKRERLWLVKDLCSRQKYGWTNLPGKEVKS